MPHKSKVLIVDDEPAIRRMVCLALNQSGFACLEAGDSAEADARIQEGAPDLILLDWMLPGTSGIDYARRLRQAAATRDIPIIMLTARTEEEDKVRGLESGSDDYITKPFSPRELVARIRALLRRSLPQAADRALVVDTLRLDPMTHRVAVGGRTLEMGPTEFRLLQFFMQHPERVHSRERILDGVWGDAVYVEERTVDVHVRRLRRILAISGHDRLIQTVRGAGYRFSTRP